MSRTKIVLQVGEGREVSLKAENFNCMRISNRQTSRFQAVNWKLLGLISLLLYDWQLEHLMTRTLDAEAALLEIKSNRSSAIKNNAQLSEISEDQNS